MFKDKAFIAPFLRIALPIALQNLFISSLGIIDTIMVGGLGETAIAAVGLANQVFFLLNFALFGINSGAAIYTAQYWGARDIAGIRRVLGVCLGLGLGMCVLFTTVALAFPVQALSFYSADPEVIRLGSAYLGIVGFSYLASTLSLCYVTILRTTGVIRFPVIVGIATLCLNTSLNYLLIYGRFGFPQMGVAGAALATSIARILECLAVLAYAYLSRSPAAASPRELAAHEPGFLAKYFKVTGPVVVNEVMWSLGTSLYSAIYAHVGTEAVAAYNVAITILNLASVLFTGISAACGVLVGNAIGAGDTESAYQHARRSLILGGGLALVIGVAVFLTRDFTLSVYNLTESGAQAARDVLGVLCIAVIYRAFNPTIIVGILRSGGDTRFSAVLDVSAVWVVALPLAYLGAFVLELPIAWVVLCVLSEGLYKMAIGLYRVITRKWINNLVSF
jgi:putative MATE family efflux protein